MSPKNAVRFQLSLLFFVTVNVIAFTIAIYAVAMVPRLTLHAGYWLTVFTIASVVVTLPLSWFVGKLGLSDIWKKRLVAQPSPHAGEPSQSV